MSKQIDICKEHPHVKRRDLGDGWNRCGQKGYKHTRPNSHQSGDNK